MKVTIDLDLEMFEAIEKAHNREWEKFNSLLKIYEQRETLEGKETVYRAISECEKFSRLLKQITKYVFLLNREANGHEVTEEEIERAGGGFED